MGKVFDLDSPLMRALSKMADIIWLNLLTLLFFVPAIVLFSVLVSVNAPLVLVFVITWLAGLLVGPAYTGLHYVLLKMVRNEEGYITKSFFKSFRENFRQSVILAAVVVLVAGILVADLYLLTTASLNGFPSAIRVPILVVAIYLFLVSLWIFPLEARFVNKVTGTLKNAFFVSILAFPRTLGMGAVTLLPLILYYFFGISLIPFLIMFGIAAPAYVCALLYNKTFKRFEPEEEPVRDEAFSIDEELPQETGDKGDTDRENTGEA